MVEGITPTQATQPISIDVIALGRANLGLQWTLIAIATFTVLCRLYTRCIRRASSAGLDDLTIVIANGLSIFHGIGTCLDATHGVDIQIGSLSPQQQSNPKEWFLIVTLSYYFALFFVRLSIGIFILRMLYANLDRTYRKLKLAVYGCLFLNLVVTILVAAIMLHCQPLHSFWDGSKDGSICSSSNTYLRGVRAFATMSAVTDVLYMCLPFGLYWPLNVGQRDKIHLGIITVFALAICACSIGKAATVDETHTNYVYADNPSCSFWGFIEFNLGIIVANLPILHQFYAITRDDFTLLSRKSGTKSGWGQTHDYSFYKSQGPLQRSHASSKGGQREHKSPIIQMLSSGRSVEHRLSVGDGAGVVELDKDTISVRQDITVDEVYTPPPAVYVRPLAALCEKNGTDAVWTGNSKVHGSYHAHAESL